MTTTMTQEMTAEDVMTHPILTMRDDRTVRELATFLTENDISGVPVLDEGGKLVGVVTLADIVRQAGEEGRPLTDRSSPEFYMQTWDEKMNPDELKSLHVEIEGLLVRDVMTPTVFTVPHDTPVSEVARTMIAGRIHRLLVTRDGAMVGIVTSLDLLKLLSEEATLSSLSG